ncbi:hypothetical protein IH992_32975 [Candidatus Poribacteria bacterium]|nr:hypothetical protein [Candidatus Poribacteria bacterium]
MQISQSQPMDAGDFLPSNSSWLRRYFDYAYPICDAPDQFHIANGLSVLSVGCQDLFLVYDEERIRPNLWISLVAPSGICRKSTSIRIARRILERIDNHHIFADSITAAAFAHTLVEHNSGTFCWHHLEGKLKGRGNLNRFLSTLQETYNCPPFFNYALHTRRSVRIENPFVNIIAATFPESIGSWLKEGNLKGGLLPRFLWVRADTRTRFIAFPPEPPKALEDELVEKLALIRQTFRGEMMLSAEAESMYSEFVSQLQQDVSDEILFTVRWHMT